MKMKRMLALFLSVVISMQCSAAIAISYDPEFPDEHGTYGTDYDEEDFAEFDVDNMAQTGGFTLKLGSGLSGRTSTNTASHRTYTYNGTVRKPAVIVMDSKGKKIAASNYTVKYASGRKNVGSYKVTVMFKGTKYAGSMSTTFTINPKATTLKSVKAASKGFTAKWAKQATQTTGYQLQYSTNSKFTGAKTITIAKNKTVSKKVTKLTAKKKYYVRIRTYKTVSGKKYYSAWSKAKAVITKK
ncbi:MAG: fibronectin type III domain-containing protein [Eubacteriales bacterium]|nr:fibronectin type III domain-containing protein [Eubacteriales bacterium]